MNIKEEIEKIVETILRSLTEEEIVFVVEHPAGENHGDYATNAALVAFGGVKASGNLTPSAAGILPAVTHLQASTYNRGEEIVMAQGLSIKS